MIEPLPPFPLVERVRDAACPGCGGKVRLAERAGTCGSCGTGAVCGDGGAVLPVGAWPAVLEPFDVPRALGDALRARLAPRQSRIVELRRVELPYWIRGGEALEAAFATPIVAARRVPAPAAAARPAAAPPLRISVPAPAGATGIGLLPAFDVRYVARGRAFHALVDAHRGLVLADLYPPPWTVRVHVAMASVLVLDLGAFAAAAWLAPDNLARTLLVALLAVPVYGFTAAAFRLRERTA